MANSQNNNQSVDVHREIIDLDELLRFLAGAVSEDVAMRGLAVALLQAKRMSGELRAALRE